jgi:predicted Zn-dependent peptidase
VQPRPTESFVTLANGVRVVTLADPASATASVGVFVRSGSAHESRAFNGIGHVIEHMVFKGTGSRSARQINLDAERLGAEVNAHTDKDHTAFHMRGLAGHATDFVAMLADLVQHATFPEDEFEREREVLLHEYTEVEEDPMATAFELFDRACYALHPLAQPVIGTRRNIERFRRADLVAHVQRQFSAANVVVGAAGGIDPAAIVRAVEAAFGAMRAGTPNLVEPPGYHGDVRSRALPGSSQTHLVLGFPIPGLVADESAHLVAAALLGEGMSSPLMEEIREKRGLVYYAACSADRYDVCGQLVVEASIAPDKLEETLETTMALIARQADRIEPVDMERALNQIAVRQLRDAERPLRRLEDAALDLFVHGRLRGRDERRAQAAAVDAAQVRGAFAGMLEAGPSLAITGKVGRGAVERAREALARGRSGALRASGSAAASPRRRWPRR